jgi:anthranilate phosphoribosyltransferase
VDEVVGMARVMREHAMKVPMDEAVVDTCGTGGDASGTFNVSTAAAFVVAGAGARVAKHGNRAMTSACGSADVLEALGAKIDLGPGQVARCLREVGFGFMFAQAFHPAMKHVAAATRSVRTVFNIRPLVNPPVPPTAPRRRPPELALCWRDALLAGRRHALVASTADELSPSARPPSTSPRRPFNQRGATAACLCAT